MLLQERLQTMLPIETSLLIVLLIPLIVLRVLVGEVHVVLRVMVKQVEALSMNHRAILPPSFPVLQGAVLSMD